MDDIALCPGCNEPVDPANVDAVLAESTVYAGFVDDGGMRRIVPDRHFHRACLDAKRGVGWQPKQ